MSLAFLADNSTLKYHRAFTALLQHESISNYPGLKKGLEEI